MHDAMRRLSSGDILKTETNSCIIIITVVKNIPNFHCVLSVLLLLLVFPETESLLIGYLCYQTLFCQILRDIIFGTNLGCILRTIR